MLPPSVLYGKESAVEQPRSMTKKTVIIASSVQSYWHA
jgi:hypothetical protein